MIRPLRRRHLLMVALLAVAVPLLYVAALAARPEEPRSEAPPTPLRAEQTTAAVPAPELAHTEDAAGPSEDAPPPVAETENPGSRESQPVPGAADEAGSDRGRG